MRLYDYAFSSAAYRVRIAASVKGIDLDHVPVDLRAGEQDAEAYRARNPAGLVPALEVAEGILPQSLAIIEYLDELYPEPPLLPETHFERARVRALALTIAADVHPLNNSSVRAWLGEHGIDEAGQLEWQTRWMHRGLRVLEAAAGEGPYLTGEWLTLADVCLVPQLYNARRFGVDISPFPRLRAVDEALNALPAVAAAHPDRQ